MEDSIEDMLRRLEIVIRDLRSEINRNHLEGSLDNIKNIKDEVKKKQILSILKYLQKCTNQYVEKVED